MAITVYDFQGNKRDMNYLRSKYGDFVIQKAASGKGSAYKITVLREKVNTDASLNVAVKDSNGTPIADLTVAWYWPDAPDDPNAGPKGGVPDGMNPNRCLTGPTKVDGIVGFGMGHGAYYWPDKGEIGPHATWIHGSKTRSDLVLGLGMIAATNHDHFDVEYTRIDDDDGGTDPEPPDPEPPDDECPRKEIRAELRKIEKWTKRIDGSVEKIRKMLE